MMDNPLLVIGVVLSLVVVVVLALGLGNFARGGDGAGSRSNRLMRYRLIFQAVAVIAIVAAAYWKSKG